MEISQRKSAFFRALHCIISDSHMFGYDFTTVDTIDCGWHYSDGDEYVLEHFNLHVRDLLSTGEK